MAAKEVVVTRRGPEGAEYGARCGIDKGCTVQMGVVCGGDDCGDDNDAPGVRREGAGADHTVHGNVADRAAKDTVEGPGASVPELDIILKAGREGVPISRKGDAGAPLIVAAAATARDVEEVASGLTGRDKDEKAGRIESRRVWGELQGTDSAVGRERPQVDAGRDVPYDDDMVIVAAAGGDHLRIRGERDDGEITVEGIKVVGRWLKDGETLGRGNVVDFDNPVSGRAGQEVSVGRQGRKGARHIEHPQVLAGRHRSPHTPSPASDRQASATSSEPSP